MKIEVSKIRLDKNFNPRFSVSGREVTSLAQSMKSQLGQISPIIVTKDFRLPDVFQLVDGLHRLKAAQRAGRKRIEAVVLDLNDTLARRAALSANSLTNPLHWLEIGKRAAEIVDDIPRSMGRMKMEAEIAKELGVERKTVEKYISVARSLHPEAWKLCLKLSKKELLGQNQIINIYRLPVADQLTLLQQAATLHDSASVTNLVDGFLNMQTTTREPNFHGRPREGMKQSDPPESECRENLASQKQQKVEEQRFFPMYTFELEGIVHQATEQGSIQIKTNKKQTIDLNSKIHQLGEELAAKVKPGDHLKITAVAETSWRKEDSHVPKMKTKKSGA